MRKWFLVAGMALVWGALLVSVLKADAIDEAEAKRRGVPVEQVQLEKAKAQVVELQKQVDRLKAENAKLKAGAAQPTTRATATTIQQPFTGKDAEINAGIKSHQLVIGMTYEQACKAMEGTSTIGGPPKLINESEGEKVYEWSIYTERESGMGGGISSRGSGAAAAMKETVRSGSVIGTFENGRLVNISR